MVNDIIHKGRDSRKHTQETKATTETEPIIRAGNVASPRIPQSIDFMQGCLHSSCPCMRGPSPGGFGEQMSFIHFFYCSYRGEFSLEKDSVIAFESLLLEVGVEGMPEYPRICMFRVDP